MGIGTGGAGSGIAAGTGRSVRVLLATGSSRVRDWVSEALKLSQHTSIIGVAPTGQAAISMCEERRPDVLVLDQDLSVVSSHEVAGYLMKHCPTPILVISGDGNDDIAGARSSLAAGAVDIFTMPAEAAGAQMHEWNRALLAAIGVVSRIRVVTQHSPRQTLALPPEVPEPAAASSSSASSEAPQRCEDAMHPAPNTVIAIGASTGGPAAVTAVLAGLPRPPRVPVLLVLHVNESFHPSLTRWLRDTTGHQVRSVEHGEPVAGTTGSVITVPPGSHLEVRGGLLVLTDDPPRHSCKPSIDVLFESIAREFGPSGAACLLTGMGRDGAGGLLAIRRAGGFTIAQDEATSVVYGMPAEAARLGAARVILPIDQIGLALRGLTSDQTIAGAK